MAREDLHTVTPWTNMLLPLLLSAASACQPCVRQLLTGNSLWCRGNPRSESGVSQLDRPQLDPSGHWPQGGLLSAGQPQQLRGRTHLDHWALFTSGIPLQVSQTQAGSFLLRLNRSPPPAPSCPTEGSRPRVGSTHPSRQLPLTEPSPGCLMLLVV